MCLHSEVGLLQQVWVCGRRIQEFDGFINQFKGRLAPLLEQGSKQDWPWPLTNGWSRCWSSGLLKCLPSGVMIRGTLKSVILTNKFLTVPLKLPFIGDFPLPRLTTDMYHHLPFKWFNPNTAVATGRNWVHGSLIPLYWLIGNPILVRNDLQRNQAGEKIQYHDSSTIILMVNPQIITNSVGELQKSGILSRPEPWDLPDCPNQRTGDWALRASG